MKFGERIAALDRLQHDRLFKIIATAVIVLAGIVGFTTYLVKYKPVPLAVQLIANSQPEQGANAAPAEAPSAETSGKKDGVIENKVATAEDAQLRVAERAINDILALQADPTAVGVAIGSGTLLAVLVVWLGLGIWYFGVALIAGAGIALGTYLPAWAGLATFVVGAVALWAAFIALIEGARLLLSLPHQVFSIARNTLDEAIRMKVSLVFVVLLMFLLAALPLLLDPNQPLRYRVQQFLQYGTGLSYTIIAVLTVLFAVYTVAVEQRERVIWQTVTKPVSAWQYVTGKWLGVVTLSAILLGVTGVAVFLFTEYLRAQPAQGEVSADHVADASSSPLTPDRRILETQILTARVATGISPPDLDPAAVKASIEARIKTEQITRPNLGKDPAELRAIEEEFHKTIMMEYRAVPPGMDRVYNFDGLQEAKRKGVPVILRYRPEAGSNRPDLLFTLTFLFPNGASAVEKVALAQYHNIALSPAVIDDNGRLSVSIFNGDFFGRTANPNPVYFSPDALEVSYAAGSYRTNFMRVFAILWLKTAFVAMAGVFSATFLSFPVATLTAFGIFLIAESSRFVQSSLDNWNVTDGMGHDVPFYLFIEAVARVISWPMQFYSDLKPTQRLVDGLLLPWSSVATSGLLLVVLIAGLLAVGSLIFRSRELAIYSGN